MNPWSTTLLAHLVMAAYPIIGIVIGATVTSRHRAVLLTLLLGFLFLPSTSYEFGPLHWTRWTAPILTCFFSTLLFDAGRFRNLRPQLSDLPMVMWCLSPGLSSLSNSLGAYDATKAVVYQTIVWGGIYLLGRLYFTNRASLFDLARYIVYGCLVYMPLCLFEFRFSPQLHLNLYGFHQHEFQQSIRSVGYRPMVFLQHGLMASMWMGMGAFLCGVLTKAKQMPSILGVPPLMWTLALTGTFFIMQSYGAIALFVGAWFILWLTTSMRSRFALIALVLLPTLWAGLRTTGVVPTQPLVQAASAVSPERAVSLGSRLGAEDDLIRHVQRRMVFGWSAWGRDRYIDDRAVVIDGLWVLTLSRNGLFGLMSLLLVWMVPCVSVLRRFRADDWRQDSSVLVLGAFTIIVAISMVDNLLNAMLILPFLLLLGALPKALEEDAEEPNTAPESLPLHQPPPGDEVTRPRILGG
jgi:hypothetical protein